MALSTAAGLATFDMSATSPLDLSPMLAQILLDDTELLGFLQQGSPATETTHSWIEDALNGNTITLSSTALDSEDPSAVFASSSAVAKRLKIGSLFRSSISGKSEVMQVIAISSATVSLTRGFGATSPEDHAGSVIFSIVGAGAQESSDMPSDRSTIRTKVSNYTQIFTDGVEISGSKQAVDEMGVPNELAFQIEKRLKEQKVALEKAIIDSYKAGTPAGSDSVYRYMSGLREFLTQSGANNTTTAEAMTESVLNAMAKLCWDDGGRPEALLVGGIQKRKISTFDEAYRKVDLAVTRVGYTVQQFITDLGIVLDVILDRWVSDDTAYVLESGKIKYLPLTGRAFFLKDIAVTGDSFKKMIVGEYTLEVRNAKEAHAHHSNLKVV